MNSTVPSGSPFTRFFKFAAKVEPGEVAAVVAGFFLFFFVLGSYFMVRPVRETIATMLGNEAVADLWLYTAIFSIAIIPVYGWLVARVSRKLLLPSIYGIVAVILVILGLAMSGGQVDHTFGKFFYVWISVLNLMLVSIFWSFLLEMFSREQTKRLFGLIAGGGTLGALVGPFTTRLVAEPLGDSGVLFLGAAGFVGAIVCQLILLNIWRPTGATAASEETKKSGVGGNPFAGITIVLKSPYLLGIALFVVLLSAANTILYFEQLRIVAETFPDRASRTEAFASIDVVVQSLTILSQVFLTGRIATKLGVRSLLIIVPTAMVLGFMALAAFNVFAVFAVVFVARRWGEYAFVRPGREMLFSSLDTESKYKAKSFIDVPVYRAADYVGGQAKTAIDALTASPTVSLVAGAVLAGGWAVTGWLLGRKHDGTKAGESAATGKTVTAAAE
ncbi:MAG: MFS transporter [Rhodospirillaceae bacterium]|nr:MFS transporter [Rhodospirillaceae bacterium]